MGLRREVAPARKVEAGVCERGPSFPAPGRGWRTEHAGAAPSLAWLRIPGLGFVKSPGDPAALGLVLPSSSYPAGNDTKLGSSPYFRDVPGRCGRTRPELCGPDLLAGVRRQSPAPLTVDTQELIDRKSVFKYFWFLRHGPG